MSTKNVGIILGSESDLKIVEDSKMLKVFNKVGVTWELSVISAHRNPSDLGQYVRDHLMTDMHVFIGIAGMAAALPGAISAYAEGMMPVLGVALSSSVLDGMDALLAMVRMPPGRPVAVCGIDEAGLYNAALIACQIVAGSYSNSEVALAFRQYMASLSKSKPFKISLLSSDKKEGGE